MSHVTRMNESCHTYSYVQQFQIYVQVKILAPLIHQFSTYEQQFQTHEQLQILELRTLLFRTYEKLDFLEHFGKNAAQKF